MNLLADCHRYRYRIVDPSKRAASAVPSSIGGREAHSARRDGILCGVHCRRKAEQGCGLTVFTSQILAGVA